MHVAVVFSLKQNWLKCNPDAAGLRIRVLSKAKFDRIRNCPNLNQLLPNQYRRWVNEEGVIECKTELEAWKAAIKVRDRLISQKRRVDLHFGDCTYQPYVFQMQPSVLNVKAFKRMNPNLPEDGRAICVYVGMTSKPIVERYHQHRSSDHPANTKWERKFFITPFDDAWRSDLVQDYRMKTKQQTDGLDKFAALSGELSLRQWLQQLGIAAYSC